MDITTDEIPEYLRLMKSLTVFVIFFLTSSAIAGDVGALFRICTAPKSNQVAEPYCLGLIAGIGEVLEMNGAIAAQNADYRNRELICPPKSGSANGDRVEIVLTWARAHPDEQGAIDVVGVIAALQEAWPCHFSN